MNNRLKMLQVNLDSDDSDKQPNPPPPQQKQACFGDRFQSSTVVKGMFYNQNEEIDYEIIPIIPKPSSKMKEEQSLTHHPKIKIINQIQYDNEDGLSKTEIDINHHHQKQNQTHLEQQKSQQMSNNLENIISPFFTRKMLQIVLSDSSSSDTEGNEQTDMVNKQQKVQKQTKQKHALIQRIDPQKLFQEVTDLNQFSRKFNLQPVPPNKFLQLTVFRNSSGLNNFWPEYKVFVGQTSKHILVCKKMMGSTTSNFYITTQEGIQKVDHANFIAKLRSNFLGSVYNVFDKGVNPQKQSKLNKTRTIQATIRFNSQDSKMQPRQFQLFLLKHEFSYYDLDGVIPNKEIGLDVLYQKQGNSQKIHHFKNRKPIYSPSLKGFILNFGGRVQMPSIKNFILQDNNKKQVLMQGKTTQDIFRIDISSPIPPYIGMCVCLANIDSKFIRD